MDCLEFEQTVFETSSSGVGSCISLVTPGLCATVLGMMFFFAFVCVEFDGGELVLYLVILAKGRVPWNQAD